MLKGYNILSLIPSLIRMPILAFWFQSYKSTITTMIIKMLALKMATIIQIPLW